MEFFFKAGFFLCLLAQCGLGGKFRIRCFKERETPEETLAFWGNAYPRIVN